MLDPGSNFICLLSKDEKESTIIVLQPIKEIYLKWNLPSPLDIADLIRKEKIKPPVNSFMIFKLNYTAAIRNSKEFIMDTSEREIAKTAVAIWNSAEENVKDEYHKFNMATKKLTCKHKNYNSTNGIVELESKLIDNKWRFPSIEYNPGRGTESRVELQKSAFLYRQGNRDYLFGLDHFPKLIQFTIPTTAQVLETCKKTCKKPPTIYAIFRNSVQKSLRDLNFNKFERKDVSKISSSLWRRIDSDLKTIFEILYKETNEQWRKNRIIFEFFNPLVESPTNEETEYESEDEIYNKCNECNLKRGPSKRNNQICIICFQTNLLYKSSGNGNIDEFIKFTQANFIQESSRIRFIP